MASIDDLGRGSSGISNSPPGQKAPNDEVHPGELELLYLDMNEYLLTVTRQDEELPRIDCVVRARKARAGLPNPRVRALLRGPNLRRTSGRGAGLSGRLSAWNWSACIAARCRRDRAYRPWT